MLSHVSIRTCDMDRSIDFYTRLLGLKLLSRQEIPQYKVEQAFLRDPEGKGASLELFFYRDQRRFIQAELENRIFDHIAFDIENMEAIISKMREEKITITTEPFTFGTRILAFIEDPDGTRIELREVRQK